MTSAAATCDRLAGPFRDDGVRAVNHVLGGQAAVSPRTAPCARSAVMQRRPQHSMTPDLRRSADPAARILTRTAMPFFALLAGRVAGVRARGYVRTWSSVTAAADGTGPRSDRRFGTPSSAHASSCARGRCCASAGTSGRCPLSRRRVLLVPARAGSAPPSRGRDAQPDLTNGRRSLRAFPAAPDSAKEAPPLPLSRR